MLTKAKWLSGLRLRIARQRVRVQIPAWACSFFFQIISVIITGYPLYVLQGNPCKRYREIPVGIKGKSLLALQGKPL